MYVVSPVNPRYYYFNQYSMWKCSWYIVLLFFTLSLWNEVCMLTYGVSQFTLATFLVLSSYVYVVQKIIITTDSSNDSTILEHVPRGGNLGNEGIPDVWKPKSFSGNTMSFSIWWWVRCVRGIDLSEMLDK